MKTIGMTNWIAPNKGVANSSGFAGIPGSRRANDGTFYYIGDLGGWWSSTEVDTTLAWFRNLYYNLRDVIRAGNAESLGFSVRCVRD
jgi:uncharacterized protein (TIGR02145 family)